MSLAGGSEMERGLLETLMTAPDEESTLKRSKERRKSVKSRKRSVQQNELKRSRTRENNALNEEDEMANGEGDECI